MKPKHIQKLFLLIIAGFFSATASTQTATPLDDYILDKMNGKYDIPGLAFSLVKNGKIALARGYGYANIEKDIRFTPHIILSSIGSVAKTVTATAVMKLWEQGLFQLEDPINNYLPFEIKNPAYPNTPITFRMLLCHTSSIHSDDTDPIDLNPAYVKPPGSGMPLESFIQNRLVPGGSFYNFPTTSFYNVPPGVEYRYSNTGYALLGYLVQRISGMTFAEYCKQNIFQPLCMNQTAWFYSGVDTNIISRPYVRLYGGNLLTKTVEKPLYERLDYPCSQLKTTVIDFSKYMQMHMNFGILDGIRIIDSTTEVMMRTPQVNLITGELGFPDGEPVVANIDECLGFTKITHTSEGNKVFFGHDGGDPGVSAQFWINTSNNTGAFIFADVLEHDPKFQPVPAVLNIHFFLERAVEDTITTDGLTDLTCSYFNSCQQNSDYWKNNLSKWPWNSLPMRLGAKHYYTKNQILDLLNGADNSDATIILGRALATAKLNIAQGSALSPIIPTINAAMNLIGDHRLPYDNAVSFGSPTGIQMLNLAATLNSYNSGSLNTTPCTGIPSSISGSSRVNEINKTALQYSLSVFPNPSSGNVTISFSLPQQEKVSLKIYDITGRLANTFENREFNEGAHQVTLNTKSLNAGIYLVRLQTRSAVQIRKLIIVR